MRLDPLDPATTCEDDPPLAARVPHGAAPIARARAPGGGRAASRWAHRQDTQ